MLSNKIGSTDLIISIDDYDQDNTQIARELEKLGLYATFFIETLTQGARQQIEELSARGHEIGSHTLSHPSDLKAIPIEEARSEIEASKRQIEVWTGKECKAFCYPRGRYNPEVIELVKAAGYTEARTTIVLKTTNENPYRLDTTIHVSDTRTEYKGRPWEIMADFYWAHVKKHGGYFHIWGHAKEMIRQGQLQNFINFLRKITHENPPGKS